MNKPYSFEKSSPEATRRAVEAWTPPANMGAFLDECARKYPDNLLWNFIERDETYTYEEARLAVNRAANALRGLGVRKSAHVGIMTPNSGAFLSAWFALAKLGAAAVFINTRYTPRELKYVIDDGDLTYLIIADSLLPVFEGIEEKPTSIPPDNVVVVGKAPSGYAHQWDRLVKACSPDFEPREEVGLDDLVNIQYTSGTSGFPKGCMLTHRYWITSGHINAALAGFNIQRILYNQNFFYMDGPLLCITCMHRGGAIYLVSRPSAANFVPWIRKYGIDYCFFFEAIYKQPETPADADNDLKLIHIFGFNRKNHADLERRFGTTAREAYGMTECGCGTYMPVEAADMVGSGSCGIPTPLRELRIVDDAGADVPQGSIGELIVRGPGIMLGYYKRPEANREAFFGEWFRTGDLFRQDERGYYTIVGRKKDMIRRNAENIAAREVEEVLRGIPQVKEAAAVPVPDDRVGEEVKVYVMLQEGLKPEDLPPDRILAYCRERLASFKIPRYIAYRDRFPKTESDRVEKKILIAETPDLRTGSFDAVEKTWR